MKEISQESICFFINSDWYFKLHWMERAKACRKVGYEVHILCHFTNLQNKIDFERQGFICHESYLSERSLSVLAFLCSAVKIFRLLKSINADIVHAITIKSILIGGLYSLLLHKPFVASFVGLGRVFSNDGFLYGTLRLITSLIYKVIFMNRKSVAIFEHEADLKAVKKIVGKQKFNGIVIDGAGVDLEKFDFTVESDVEIPTVLFASRLLWSKGLGKLVEIKEKLLHQGIKFELKVAGIVVTDDSDAIPLEKIKEWDDKKIIKWLGTIDDVSTEINNCHIVALPSTYQEGVPRILIEGSAKGRPCICYDSGGCYNIIVNNVNGFLIKKDDDLALTDAIKNLVLNKELRMSMGAAGRAIIEKRFSSTIVIDNTLNVYSSILNKK